ncbi:MAG TPA: ABC transporter permease [Vicinamibacterales bacterium]|nr:ABC transporter permease [Vicinamibacterales bacterium]
MIADDLKYGWRQLRKAPGFTFTAILTLGLAIGANTAVFSLVDAVLLKSLPYPQPERLGTMGAIYTRNGAEIERSAMSVTGAGWKAIQGEVKSIDAAIQARLSSDVSLVTQSRTISVSPQRVSAGYFRVLGIPPAIGREFTAEEDVVGGPALAILSDRIWRSAFNGDASVVGQTILLKGEPHVVVGVMPAAFKSNADADIWTPIRPSTTGEGGGINYGVVARLKDGVSWPQASAETGAAVDSTLARRTSNDGVTVSHMLMPLQEEMTGDVRMPLLLLSAGVGVVLLVACVNLAGLLLARAGRRTREIATRLAVGGNRQAVMRQLLIESLLLAICGGVAGLVFGALALEALKATATDLLLTPWGEVALDARVLSVTLGLTMLTAILFGLIPALQATRLDVQAALAEGGTRSVAGGARGWPRRLLVVAEVALGVVLLVGAGLLIRTFMYLETLPAGFDPARVVTVSASLEDARYAKHEDVEQLFGRSLERLRTMPGVESAAISLGLPYERILNMGARVLTGTTPSDFVFTTATYVSPGYFETLRLPLIAGRTFRETDARTSAAAVVINEAFAKAYFKDRDAVGQFITSSGATREVVGVVGNVQQRGGFRQYGPIDALPGFYMPFSQFPGGGLRTIHGWFSTAWIVRQSYDGAVNEPILRRAMAEIDPQLAVSAVRAIDDVRGATLSRQRMLMMLVGALGGLALFLAAIGIHALIASGVAERTRELGIRMALGATVGQTVRDAAMPGLIMATAGLAIGCAIAYGATGLIRSLLWGVKENDPMTFVAVVGALLAVAATASVVPALRVRKLDPVSLLRSE